MRRDVGLARRLRQELTRSEALMWQEVRGRRFRGLKFYRQRPYGRFVFDFYCPELSLALEIDGGIHRSRGRQRLDEARDRWLEARGIRVVRVTAEAVERDPRRVLASVVDRVAGGASPPAPSPQRVEGESGGGMTEI